MTSEGREFEPHWGSFLFILPAYVPYCNLALVRIQTSIELF